MTDVALMTMHLDLTDQMKLRQLAANTVRALAMDGVQKANSGHPGMPMGMADAGVVLWTMFLKHNPADPLWPDRDRFVLSAGHGSMLLYSLLHLSGYDLPLEQLQAFRQWGSLTPGHPEYGLTPGVETTTWPLGQGISNAVGMALAERWLAAAFNRPGFEIVNHSTYVIASDGDMMEGVSHESCAVAGHLGLGKLIVLYDDNGISIDGPTSLSFSEDVPARFAAYGWHTQRIDGHDSGAVESAVRAAQAETKRPSLIACKTLIGFGSPNRQNTSKAHGEPLGVDEVRLAKERLDWPAEEQFYVPAEARAFMRGSGAAGAAQQAAWKDLFARYRGVYPDLAVGFDSSMSGELPEGWDRDLPTFSADKPLATRTASGAVLDFLSPRLPMLLRGSADLTPSNNTLPKGEASLTSEDFSGRYIRFGVREHGMGSILNGLALHGGVRPYGGTFLIFSDYMRPAIRLAALMELPVVFVFTHDSIGLGEDGPTHQPIEQLTSLRTIPNLAVFRPADATETVEACVHLHRTIQVIKELGVKVGVTLNPATSLMTLEEILPEVDLVMVMSVNPGFGGQSYIPGSTARIRRLRRMLDEIRSQAWLEVDGGIKARNAAEVVTADATLLVAGSAVFGGPKSVAENITAFRVAVGQHEAEDIDLRR